MMNQPKKIRKTIRIAAAISHASAFFAPNGMIRPNVGAANENASSSPSAISTCAIRSTDTARNRLPSPASS